jgi:hypothetical protein
MKLMQKPRKQQTGDGMMSTEMNANQDSEILDDDKLLQMIVEFIEETGSCTTSALREHFLAVLNKNFSKANHRQLKLSNFIRSYPLKFSVGEWQPDGSMITLADANTVESTEKEAYHVTERSVIETITEIINGEGGSTTPGKIGHYFWQCT